ncbi:hypothetical protein K435DRAFT_965830 [Dendrothele bispora CBS 962.96]|uniref:Uncharacterized protein n=1 Tax=Dendrothele bispora (strain CBS 962.96) TaxID=1314807 RepID=A0A4S8M3P2_DENBC|nr:hypothetical protein K435DRAFT_965830 [Dendrothele bispora CBS 962.96]
MSSIAPSSSLPTLNDFSWNTIGKEPDLLRRMFPVPDSSLQHESRSSSSSPIQNEVSSQQQLTSGSRFFQALTQGATPDIQMQDSTPARRALVDIFGQRIHFPITTPSQPGASQSLNQGIAAQTPFSENPSVTNRSEASSHLHASNAQVQNRSDPQASQDEATTLSYPSTETVPDDPPFTEAYSEMRKIQSRLLQLQSSVESATNSSGSELSSALAKTHNARALAQTSLSSAQEASKALQASLNTSREAFDSATQANQLVQDAINVFGTKEEQWKKVCLEMKTDLLKLGEYITSQERRERERFELQREKEREEKVRQDREAREKRAEQRRPLPVDDVAMRNVFDTGASQPSMSSPATLPISLSNTTIPSQNQSEVQNLLQNTDARLQEIREIMHRLEKTREELDHRRQSEEEEKRKAAEEQERKRLAEVRQQAEEEKRRQTAAAATAERKRRAEEERKRKEAALEMERKRLVAEEEERRRTEQALREDLLRRKAEQEAVRRKSAEQDARKVSPPIQQAQQSSQPSVRPVSSITVPRQAATGQLNPLSPTLPAKPIFAVQADNTSPQNLTKSQRNKKGKQKVAKASKVSSDVHPGAAPNASTENSLSSRNVSRDNMSGITTSTNRPQSGGLQVQMPGNPSTASQISSSSNLINIPKSESSPVEQTSNFVHTGTKTPATDSSVAKVKQEQVDGGSLLLQRTRPATVVPRQGHQPSSSTVTNAHTSPIGPPPSSQVPSSYSSPTQPITAVPTPIPQKDVDAKKSKALPQKRRHPANTDQSQSSGGSANSQQGNTSQHGQRGPTSPRVPSEPVLPLPTVIIAAREPFPTSAVAAPQLVPAPAIAAPQPAHELVNADPHVYRNEELRQSPMESDMLINADPYNRASPITDEEPPRMATRNAPGNRRAQESNYKGRVYDHYSPSSPPRYGRSPARTPSSPRSRSPGWSRRSRSPPFFAPRHPANTRYNRWERRSRSPPSRNLSSERSGYVPRKRVHEMENDPYPVRRPYYERSPSPRQQDGSLEARLSNGDQEAWRSRPNPRADRPALLRRLRNSNEPNDVPPPRGRGGGPYRGRGRGGTHRGGGGGGARLAQRIQSAQSPDSTNNLFDRLQI